MTQRQFSVKLEQLNRSHAVILKSAQGRFFAAALFLTTRPTRLLISRTAEDPTVPQQGVSSPPLAQQRMAEENSPMFFYPYEIGAHQYFLLIAPLRIKDNKFVPHDERITFLRQQNFSALQHHYYSNGRDRGPECAWESLHCHTINVSVFGRVSHTLLCPPHPEYPQPWKKILKVRAWQALSALFR